jgi:hypothetical protein
MIRRLLKTAVPVSRIGLTMWAWHNRDELFRWAGFVATAGPKVLSGDSADVLTEAKLRARLTADHRTRGAAGLRVSVQDGVATLDGVVSPDVHDVALDLATSTGGIRKVRDELTHPSRRSRLAFS